MTSMEHIEAFAQGRWDRAARGVLLLVIFVLPFFFIPSAAAPFQFSKTLVLLTGVLLALVLFIPARVRGGSIALPHARFLFLGPWILVGAYALSALFSGNAVESFVGRQFGVDTVGFVALLALFFSLVALLFRTERDFLKLVAAFVFSGIVLGVFELVHLITGGSYTSFGILERLIDNPLGKWNDLAVFFGSLVLLSLLTLAGFPRRSRLFSFLLYGILALALCIMAVVNFALAWIVLGLFSAAFSVYFLYRRYVGGEVEVMPSISALATVALSALFLVSPVGDYLAQQFGVSHLEARPSWQSSLVVLQQTLGDHMTFGSGPNTFSEQWAVHKPLGVNGTPFWNADFASGIGHVPTSITTTGLVGALAWLFFLGAFLFAGVRLLLGGNAGERFAYTLSTVAFLMACYFWIFSIFYVPGVVNVMLAFLFTALFFTSLRFDTNGGGPRLLRFLDAPRAGFAVVLVSIIIAGAGFGALYAGGARYAAAYLFQKTTTEAGSSDEVRTEVDRVNGLVVHDQYLRYSAALYRGDLARLIASVAEPTAEDQERFRTLLTNAVDAALSARAYDPAQYQNWLELARVYALVVPLQIPGAYESATTALSEAQARNPHNPEVLLAFARIESAAGNRDEARSYITRALQKKNDYAEAAFLLAQFEIDEGNIDGAIESAEAATVLAPGDVTAYFRLGVLYFETGRYTEAAEAFGQALRREPQYLNALYFLGLSYDALKDRSRAIETFERIEEIRPGIAEVDQALSNLRAGLPARPQQTASNTTSDDTLPISE